MEEKSSENANSDSTTAEETVQNLSSGDQVKSQSNLNLPSAKNGRSNDKKSAKLQEGLSVRLEPTLAEKLIKKQAVADEFEDNLHSLRADFVDRIHFIDIVKEDLNRRERQLIKSVENIEAYLKEIHSLKCEADEMFKKLKEQLEKHNEELSNVSLEYENVMKMNENRLKIFRGLTKAKKSVEAIVQDLPNFSSTRNLVEYFIVLQVLRDDIMNEIESHAEEERLREQHEKITESLRAHPLNILVKENIIFDLKSKIKDIRAENVLNEQKIDLAITTKVKDDLTWYDIKRWISKLSISVDTVFPPRVEDYGKSTSNQLKKILDFVEKGSQIVERLRHT